jgi:TatD DNase family protein
MRYINIHSHKPTLNNKYEVISFVAGVDNTEDISSNRLYSIGIHPWYTEDLETNKEEVLTNATLPNFIAIGECGFDPKSHLSMAGQESLFIFHAQMAEKLGRPLIIHSVKTLNEVIRINKNLKPQVPWVIHGFNANIQTATECIKHGLYLSIGHQLLQPESSISKIITQLPLNNIFFETDGSVTPIEAIYARYCKLTGKLQNEVCETIYANFARHFKQNFK